MSAFIEPDKTQVIPLQAHHGGCERKRKKNPLPDCTCPPVCYCPGTPHHQDTVTIRTEYGWGDLLELSRVHTIAGFIDPMGERARLLELGIAAWTFVGSDGEPVPLGLPMILLLKQSIVEPIAEAIDEAYRASDVPLPNPSSGRSQPSSPESSTASPNRATRRAVRRSTSKSS